MNKRFTAASFSVQLARQFGCCLLLLSIIFMLSCRTPHTEAPEMNFADICKDENDGKLVAVKGYIFCPLSVLCEHGECGLDLLQDKTRESKRLDIRVTVGKEPGQMDQLDQHYSLSDFKFHTAQGDSTGMVKLIGRIYWRTYQGSDICHLNVEYAEQVEVAPSPLPSSSPTQILSPVPKTKK